VDVSGLGFRASGPASKSGADGQVAWSWPPDAEVKSAAVRKRIVPAMGARQPGPQGDREAAV